MFVLSAQTRKETSKMKKFLSVLLLCAMALTMVACGSEKETANDADVKSEGVMTHKEYIAAELDTDVVIETYVQGKQSWWNDAASLYTQDKDGAYFAYNITCTEEDYKKLEKGTKVRISGTKGEWAGEVEVMDGSLEILDGKYVAEAFDVTSLMGKDELIDHQNEFVTFKGLTVEASTDADGNEAAFLYNWDGSGDEGSDADLYFNASVNGQTFNFVVEYYTCDAEGIYGADTDVYEAVRNLQIGDTIDMEGFLYWYEGANPHITSVTVK